MASADAADAVRACRILLGARGQPRHQPSGGARRRRAATRPIASTRRRCEPADRGHRRVRVHRTPRRRASHRARRRPWSPVRASVRRRQRSPRSCAAPTRVVHLAGVVSAVHERDYVSANVDGTRTVAGRGARRRRADDPHFQPRRGRSGARRVRRDPRRTRRRRSTPTAAASSRANARSPRSTACAGRSCVRASSMVLAIARCCRCSVWRSAAILPLVGRADAAYTFIHIADLLRVIAAAIDTPASRRHAVRRPSANRCRRAACSKGARGAIGARRGWSASRCRSRGWRQWPATSAGGSRDGRG